MKINYKKILNSRSAVLLLVGAASWQSITPALAVDACDRQPLGVKIRDNSRIYTATTHPSGVVDNANARQNIADTANGLKAKTSCYGNATCSSTYLDPRLLDCMDRLENVYGYSYSVSELSGASHSVGSKHYYGRAIDVYIINGYGVSAGSPYWSTFLQREGNMGASELCGPASPYYCSGHDTHVHAGWTDNGGNVAASGCNRMDVFIRGAGDTLQHKFWANNIWSTTWTTEETGITSDPTVVAWGPNRLDIFCQGADTQLKHKWWTGSVWSTGWENLGNGFVGSPDACSWGVGRLDVFALSSTNTLLHKWWNGTLWSPTNGWTVEGVGGLIASDPTAISMGPDLIDVFARGTDNLMKHISFSKTAGWSAWSTIGTNTLVGGPDAASMKNGSMDVFCRSTAGDLLQYFWRGSSWVVTSQGLPAGLTLTSDPGATAYASNTLYVTARASDNQCWRLWWDGSTWATWSSLLGGSLLGGPDICSWSNTAGTR